MNVSESERSAPSRILESSSFKHMEEEENLGSGGGCESLLWQVHQLQLYVTLQEMLVDEDEDHRNRILCTRKQ